MEHIEEYNTIGYTKYPKFLQQDFVNLLNKTIDEMVENIEINDDVFDEDNTGKIKQIQFLHKKHDVFVELLNKMEPIINELLGGLTYNILNVQLFEKHPEISKPTRAHQDNAYFKQTPATPLTIWIALDDIDEMNGCLYYAPYTHKTPTRKHSRYHSNTTFRMRSGVLGLSLCLHEHPEECDIPMIVEMGDVFVHNSNTIHRAGKNNTLDKRRRAIGIAVIPTNCKLDDRLNKYHQEQLKEDVELQKIKNPALYRKLVGQITKSNV
jgi:phytanoyl-CoA hydroxylase